MKPKTKRRLLRLPRTYSEAQLAGIKQSTMARRLATVERLRTAIDALKAKKQEISVQTIYDECGLRYAAIHRNPEALAEKSHPRLVIRCSVTKSHNLLHICAWPSNSFWKPRNNKQFWSMPG